MLRNCLLVVLLFFFSCNYSENNSKSILEKTTKQNNISILTDSTHKLTNKLSKLYDLEWIDSLNARVINKTINIYDPDKFLKEIISDTQRLEKFKTLSERTNNLEALSYAYNMFGKNKRNCSDYISSIQYHKKAYETALLINDEYLEALSLNMMGVVYRHKSAVKTALEYYVRALKTAEESNNQADYMLKSIAISNEGIGGLYRLLKQYKLAIKYYKSSLEYEEKLNSLLGMAIDNHNIGKSYGLLGQYDSANFYHNKSLEYNNQMNSIFGKAICYNSLGTIAMNQNKIRKAYDLFIPALKMAEKSGSSTYIVNSNLNLGWYHIETGNIDSARSYIKKALLISNKLGKKAALLRGYELLSELEQKKGNYLVALQLSKKANIYNDSIINEKNQQYLADLTILYDIEKKRGEIESLNKENETKKQKLTARNQLIITLILLVIVIVSIAYFFRQRGMQKLNQMESELQKYLLKIKDSDIDDNKKYIDNNSNSGVRSTQNIGNGDLTDRETEVLHLISEGMSNADIAEKIFVSTNTIKYHIKNIYLKLDVKNRVEALNKINK
jgi:DNA-binding CsgD family transcriptional regulator/tetratricopeptide (TPR) repeat protein